MRHTTGIFSAVIGFGLLWLSPVTFVSVGPTAGLLLLGLALVLLALGSRLSRRSQPLQKGFKFARPNISHIEQHPNHTHL